MSKPVKKIKVGFIIDEDLVSAHTMDILNLASKENNYKSLLIVQKNNRRQNLFGFVVQAIRRRHKSIIPRLTFRMIIFVEKLCLDSRSRRRPATSSSDIRLSNFKKIFVNPEISKSGLVYRYSLHDIDQIKHSGVDILVRCGSGILRGPILSSMRHGVISMHHGDNRKYRGGPPGFWEVFNKEPSTGFVIQKLTEELDGGDVLFHGDIPTEPFFYMNQCAIKRRSVFFLHKILSEISISGAPPRSRKNIPYGGRLFTVPSLMQQILYLFKTFKLVFGFIKDRSFHLRNVWSIGYQFIDNWRDSSVRQFVEINQPYNRFYADPFVIKKNGKWFIFFEDFDFKRGKADISALEVSGSSQKLYPAVLSENFHLSFPFIFELENRIFMVPESAQARKIILYEATDFPKKWKKRKVIVENIRAADSLIFQHGDKWWLFTNSDSSGGEDSNSELNIFFADHPLEGTWLPHKMNPVIFDSKTARNAGLLIDDAGIYRVFQRFGWRNYGESVGIAKIKTLTESSYIEELASTLNPDFSRRVNGLHTFNFNSGLVVSDFNRKRPRVIF